MSNLWTDVQLSEVCEINMGQSPSSSTYNSEMRGIPFFQGKSEFTEKYAQVKIWCSEPQKIAQQGDVLISVRAPVGISNIAPEKCCIGRGLAALKSNTLKLDQNFLWHVINSQKRYLEGIAQGSTFDAISNKDLSTLPLKLPPLHEQKKISNILSVVDSMLLNLEKEVLKYRFLMKALINQEFEYKLNDDILFSLKDIVNPNRPISYGIVQTGKNLKEGIPCVRVVDMNNFSLNIFSMIKTSIEISNKYKKTILQGGDLIVALRGSIGKTCFVSESLSGSNLTRGVALISSSKKFNSEYIRYAMKSNLVSQQIKDVTNGSALQEIPLKNLRKIKVPLPSLDKQFEVVKKLKIIEKLIQNIDFKKQLINQLKNGLSSDLLSGRKRINN